MKPECLDNVPFLLFAISLFSLSLSLSFSLSLFLSHSLSIHDHSINFVVSLSDRGRASVMRVSATHLRNGPQKCSSVICDTPAQR